jgi:hypothetical protein
VYFQSDKSNVTASKRGMACSKAVAKLQEALMAFAEALPPLHLAVDLGGAFHSFLSPAGCWCITYQH